MAGSRRPLLLLLLPLLSTGVELLAGSVPVAASGCSGAYVAQLGQVRSELTEGGSVPAAEEQLQTLASADHAASALDPVIADLQSGDLAGAERLLGATVAALQVSGSGCGAETGAERQALSRVYQSPAFANLDQPPSPNWLQQLGNAIAGFLGRVLGTLGPLGGGALAALLLALVAAVAAWRVRQVMASGRLPRPMPGAAPAEADAEAEWARALAASERGDFRLGVRHAFRSALVSLAQRGRLPVQPAWTTPELLDQARADPELTAQLAPAAAGFDRAWYSEAPVDADRWEEIRGHCQAIRALSGRGRPAS
ncbi:MAG: DUF4129 domain-containing protein [Candidatus Dormibacteria bacterium]